MAKNTAERQPNARALGGNDAEDKRRFAAAAKVSEINLALYRTCLQPYVRAMLSPPVSELIEKLHPLRLPYETLSDDNPLMAPVMADEVRKNRAPAAPDNPFIAVQESASRQIVAALDAWRDMRDAMSESLFLTVYGSPLLQAGFGIDPADTRRPRLSGTNPLYNEMANARIAEIRAKIGKGGVREATVRALIYIAMPRAAVDERAFHAIRRLRTRHLDGKGSALPGLTTLSLAEFKTLVREQSFMLVVDQKAAVAAIPGLLSENLDIRRKVFDLLRELLEAPTEITGEVANRLKEAAVWFGVDPETALDLKVLPLSTVA